MSIEIYEPYGENGPQYEIGTIGREPFPIKVDGIFGTFMNIVSATYNNIKGIMDIWIPTYGLWGGPGWSAGDRVSNIKWTTEPCYNISIKEVWGQIFTLDI